MRQIDVRGWYIKEKRWATEEELKDFTSIVIEQNKITKLSIDGGDEENNGEPYFIIEQCTDVKDKFEDWVYEGDILEDETGKRAVVTWEAPEFLAWWRDPEEKDAGWNILSLPQGIVVVGNVHEHPELLQE